MAKKAHTADPTPGAAITIGHPRLIEAEGAIRELLNNEDLEEKVFSSGRVYWPDEQLRCLRIDLDYDRFDEGIEAEDYPELRGQEYDGGE